MSAAAPDGAHAASAAAGPPPAVASAADVAAAHAAEKPASAIELGLIEDGPFERCLEPLLQAAGWRGDVRQILEALPHLEQLQSVNDLRLVLHRLGFRSSVDLLHVDEIIDERLPALWAEGGAPMVVLARRPGGAFLVYDSAEARERIVAPPGRRMRLCRVYSLLDGEAEAAAADHERLWLRGAVFRLRGEAGFAAGLTFGANLLALTAPLFTMTVYNAILPSEGVETLFYLIALAVGVLAFESYLRAMRAQTLSTAAARLNCAILTKSFAQILCLPAAMVENASVSAQINRVKQFESIVGSFSGAALGALFDLPFLAIFLIAIGVIGGPLAFAPVAAIGLFVVLGVLLAPAGDRAARRAALLKDRAATLTYEMLTNLDSIHDLGAAAVWRRRVGDAHRRAVGARIRASFLDHLRSSGSLFIISLSMIVTVCFGALMVMQGALSLGALVAVSMLGARVLGPVQTLFMAIQQIGASREAAQRFESLLRLKSNPTIERAPAAFRRFKGAIRIREVAFRFPNADEFALRGLSAEIKAGEIIGLIGPGGSGKSTVLKMLLGHYRPVSGQIYIDGANMAQIHLSELRGAIAYATADPAFFYGTVAQNMRLGRPMATDEEIETVLEELGVVLDAARFPEGVQTRLGADDFMGLSAALRQKLSLARAFVKEAPITLLDEPAAMLAPADQQLLWRAIQRRRGAGTTLMTLSDVAMIGTCDRVMGLAGGRLLKFDAPEAFRKKT